jgi:hypothetical protein
LHLGGGGARSLWYLGAIDDTAARWPYSDSLRTSFKPSEVPVALELEMPASTEPERFRFAVAYGLTAPLGEETPIHGFPWQFFIRADNEVELGRTSASCSDGGRPCICQGRNPECDICLGTGYIEAPTRNNFIASSAPEYGDIIKIEWMCEIRKLFSNGGIRQRRMAITELAAVLGFERVTPVIGDVIDKALKEAVKRGIIENEGGSMRLHKNNIYEYYLDFLKEQFLETLERHIWCEQNDAIKAFACWMGYVGITDIFNYKMKSVINGLVGEQKLECEGTSIRKI